MSRGRSNGSRMRRNSVWGASVLQRPQWYRHSRRRRRQCSWSGRSLPVKILPAYVTARRKDPVAGVRERHSPILVSRCDVQRLRCVIRKTTETVRDRPMEMHERHVRRPRLWRVRRRRATQQYERYTTCDYNAHDWPRWRPYFYCNTTHMYSHVRICIVSIHVSHIRHSLTWLVWRINWLCIRASIDQ